MIAQKDKEIVRGLALQVTELSALPVMEERRALWKRKNALLRERPAILTFPEGAWRELLPGEILRCQSLAAREIEWKLRARLYRYEHFYDDFVVEPTYNVYRAVQSTGFGLEPEFIQRGDPRRTLWDVDDTLGCVPRVWDPDFQFNAKSWHYGSVLKDWKDVEKIVPPVISEDQTESSRRMEIARELLGDAMELREVGVNRVSLIPFNLYTKLRGLEQSMFDAYDQPDLMHAAMRRLTDALESMVRQYEELGLFTLNNDGAYVGSGGVGYTDELPSVGFSGRASRRDLWANAESQETSSMSPDFHAEFVFPYEKELIEGFGLTAYGCCEPLDAKFSTLAACKNLRRVSISPWADVAVCSELVGNRYVFSYKPNPALLASGYDPAHVERCMQENLALCRDNCTEVILKDTHTCENRPERFDHWGKTARRIAESLS